MHRLSATIVVYGGADEARLCVESLVRHTDPGEGFALYLVDNCSPDDTLQKLSQPPLPQNVRLLPQERNRGFGGGHNVVLPLLDSRYHAVVNPDILLEGDALSRMADWMDAHPDVVMTTPNLVFPDGRVQHIAKRRPAVLPLVARQTGIRALKKYEDHYLMLDEDLTKPIDVAFCSGSFFMMRTEVFREIGGFDEGYFMYVEDADITQKALTRGRAVFLPEVTVIHKWHRAAHKGGRAFWWQLKSMLRYFSKWGLRWK